MTNGEVDGRQRLRAQVTNVLKFASPSFPLIKIPMTYETVDDVTAPKSTGKYLFFFYNPA